MTGPHIFMSQGISAYVRKTDTTQTLLIGDTYYTVPSSYTINQKLVDELIDALLKPWNKPLKGRR